MFDACGRSSHAIFCTCLDCYNEAVLIHTSLRLQPSIPIGPSPFERGSDHGETPWVTWGALLGLQWEEFGGWQGGLNWGGYCSWLSRGYTNSRLIYRGTYMDLPIWSGEAMFATNPWHGREKVVIWSYLELKKVWIGIGTWPYVFDTFPCT